MTHRFLCHLPVDCNLPDCFFR